MLRSWLFWLGVGVLLVGRTLAVAALTDGDAGADRRRRRERWQDAGIAVSGLAFTASLTVGLGAALSRQWLLAGGLAITGSADVGQSIRAQFR